MDGSGQTSRNESADPDRLVEFAHLSLTDPDILQSIIDHLPCGVTLFGNDLLMRACNDRFKELLDFPDSLFAAGLPSMRDLAVFNAGRGEYGPGEPQELAARVLERARAMQPHVFERARPNGTILEIRGRPVGNGGFVSIYTDITDRKLAERALEERTRELEAINQALAASNEELVEARLTMERMAMHDQLTGLANRHRFLQAFAIETERRNRTGQPLSLLLIDIDHFKMVNDRFGHLAGDACLKTIAAILETNLRTADLIGRFGGEEFVVLLPDTDANGAKAAAENLRQRVRAAELDLDGQKLTVTISIGIAALPPGPPGDFESLIRRADGAVYRAKDQGRDTVVVSDDIPD